MTPLSSSRTSDNADLWIECPHCEGAAGWYGCEHCGEVLGRDEPLGSRLCEACQKVDDCYREHGDHAWRLTKGPHDPEWLLVCKRGCGGQRTIAGVQYQQRGDRWMYVGAHAGREYVAEGGR